MKLFSKQKNSYKKNQGFALLFSVLLSSVLLSIGLSIFSITLKELAISTAARQSVMAFSAADSGRECALYWDTKRGQIPTLKDNSVNPGSIKCGGQAISVSGSYTPSTGSLGSANSVSVEFISFVLNGQSDGLNFKVTLSRSKSDTNLCDPDSSLLKTFCSSLVSSGYDIGTGDRVERAIEQIY